jgi:SAM-dependent methyltransferase
VASGQTSTRGQRSSRVRAVLSHALLIPRVAWLGRRTPTDLTVGWEHYWSSVGATGVGGDVLWDTGDLGEMLGYLPIMRKHLDTSLPIIDIGCGNGRFTRRLVPMFGSVVGIDLSPSAVAMAKSESPTSSVVQFRSMDATVPGATDALATEFAPANVFVRGVFHILDPAARVELARNLLPLTGGRGRVFLAETDFRGGGLDYLASLGATSRWIPGPLERAIRDLPRPGHFGPGERAASFDGTEWDVIVDGPTVIETIPLRGATEPERIPGYFAVLAASS